MNEILLRYRYRVQTVGLFVAGSFCLWIHNIRIYKKKNAEQLIDAAKAHVDNTTPAVVESVDLILLIAAVVIFLWFGAIMHKAIIELFE